MTSAHPLNRPDALAEQYKTSANLQARMNLHRRFATNPQSWFDWVFGHFEALPANARILELGCGTGKLWAENAHRIPAGWRVTLSDISFGMLEQTRQTLAHLPARTLAQFSFERANAEEIPLEDASLDAVIANHMLYHMQNLGRALAGVCRALKPRGKMFAATNGAGHMQELDTLMEGFVENIMRGTLVDGFNLENGEAILKNYFGRVEKVFFENDLLVTDADALADYILSMRGKMPEERVPAFRQHVGNALKQNGGAYRIHSNSGLFIAS